MNVLKKDLFAKPGARGKANRSHFTNTTAFNSAQFARNVLPYLPNSSSSSGLKQHTHSSGSTSFSTLEPPDQHRRQVVKQSAVAEANSRPPGSERPADHRGYSSQYPANKSEVFKKPHHTPSSTRNTSMPQIRQNSKEGIADDSGSTNDVLRALSDTSTSQPFKYTSRFDLTYRPPTNQNEEVLEDSPAGRLGAAYSGVSELSSIRANTSNKVTPRASTAKSPRTPKTSSSTTAAGLTDSDQSCCIVAVTEGRGLASGEVGIAAMDPRRPHLVLCQISDSQRYARTLTKLNVFNLTEAIVPNTFVEGPTPRKLYMDLLDRFPAVTVNHVQRRHFSEATGLQMIQQYCSRESESVMVVVKDKFYALAAASALLKYVEFTQNVLFAPNSLKVEYQGTEGTTIIDLDTANRLELVMGILSRDEQQSLLGVLKQCRTRGGTRLLRANLLQPPSDPLRINSRLDCVTELIENAILFNVLEGVISQMKNAESLLGLCMHPPQQSGLKAAQSQLKYVMLLKSTLELVPALSAALADANAHYFRQARENLGDVRLKSVLNRVHKTVTEGSPGSRIGTFNQLQACYMICPGINGLLDIAKKTYSELAQEISDLVEELKEKLGLPMRLGLSQSKGYHIVMSPLDQLPDTLPPQLILCNKSRNALTCTTSEIVALDQRCQQALHEIELMTNVLLFELLNDVREEISCLFPLCECLAELDVCIAFALVSVSGEYTRPVFDNHLHLEKARHPILDVISKEKLVANDVFADDENNFAILTGPNQSGKSIYIRQIALLQVMAQVGCYVPAAKATFRLADRIFSRIGFDDSIEGNASTLMVELQDMEFIRNNLTPNSLVIVDELCRGTSVDEGTVLAFVLCEQLIDTSAFVFFTTHFLFLTKLQDMYSNVRNFHFETTLRNDAKPTLCYTYKMLEGITRAEQYGIRLAQLMGFLPDILATAECTASLLLVDRKPQPELCGLTERYLISQKMRMNLPSCDDAAWDQLLPVIRQYKEQYAALPPEPPGIEALLHLDPNDTGGNESHEINGSYNRNASSPPNIEDAQYSSQKCCGSQEITNQMPVTTQSSPELAVSSSAYEAIRGDQATSDDNNSPLMESSLSSAPGTHLQHHESHQIVKLSSSQGETPTGDDSPKESSQEVIDISSSVPSVTEGTIASENRSDVTSPPPSPMPSGTKKPCSSPEPNRVVLKPSKFIPPLKSQRASNARVSRSNGSQSPGHSNRTVLPAPADGEESSVIVTGGDVQNVQVRVDTSRTADIPNVASETPPPLDDSQYSEGTKFAAMLLLSLGDPEQSNSTEEKKRSRPSTPENKDVMKIQNAGKRKKAKTGGKPEVSEFVRGLGADLPPVCDKAPFYQWKYSKNQKALAAVATASRPSPLRPTISPIGSGTWLLQQTGELLEEPKQMVPDSEPQAPSLPGLVGDSIQPLASNQQQIHTPVPVDHVPNRQVNIDENNAA